MLSLGFRFVIHSTIAAAAAAGCTLLCGIRSRSHKVLEIVQLFEQRLDTPTTVRGEWLIRLLRRTRLVARQSVVAKDFEVHVHHFLDTRMRRNVITTTKSADTSAKTKPKSKQEARIDRTKQFQNERTSVFLQAGFRHWPVKDSRLRHGNCVLFWRILEIEGFTLTTTAILQSAQNGLDG